MKTIFKYIATVAFLAGLCSCQSELKQIGNLPADEVELTFRVQFPEPVRPATRGSMADGALESEAFEIFLCLYGSGDGYVQNWIPTTNVSYETSGGYITGGTFKALLPLTTDLRIVHVIANPPADAGSVTSDYMDNVMEKLVNFKGTADECSYWQQIVLPDGIRASGANPAPALVAAFSDIHLVRNFAKITVSDIANGDFTVKSWALINTPDRGYVAPYNQNWKSEGRTSRFPEGYLSVEDYNAPDAPVKLYDKLVSESYAGYMPPEAQIDDSFPEDASKFSARGGTQYMYERPLPDEAAKQTALLVEIEFPAGHDPAGSADAASYWYKFEMLDNQGEYMPIYRNVAYSVVISEVTSAGALTARDAYDGAYFGNISASLETSSLNDLSNGTSTIHVDVMDFTFTAGGVETTLMRSETEAAQFWFIPDDSAPEYKYESEAGVCDIKVELLPVNGFEPAVTSIATPGSGSIKVTLSATGSQIKKSVIRISARKGDNVSSNTEPYLYREITVNLMETPDFVHGANATRITNTPEVNGAGNEVDIDICLPENLGSSVFPIQVRIEAQNNTLSATTPDLPVRTGKSVYDPSKNTFYYVFTVNYSDYCHLDTATHKFKYTYEFPIKLFTGKTGDNSTKIHISDLDGFFNPIELTLGTVTP